MTKRLVRLAPTLVLALCQPSLFAQSPARCGGFFTRDGKWAVENDGVGPDIDVENWPKDVIAGRDLQLEKTVEDALRILTANPVHRMTTEPTSPTWGERKRGGSH